MGKFWGATEGPPDLDKWLNDQVEKAIQEYIAAGTIELDIEDASVVLFCAAEPADEIEVKMPLQQLFAELFEMHSGANGLLQLSPEDRIRLEKLRSVLAETLKRLDEEMATAQNVPSWR